MKKESPSIDSNHVSITLSWASIRHNSLFEHITALGSRFDMLITANSILIAGLIIILSGSAKSDSVHSKIDSCLSKPCFLLLAISLISCIISAFCQVRPKKCTSLFFKARPENITDFVNEIYRYANKAESSIRRRHLLLNISAFSLISGLILLTIIVFKYMIL